MNTSLLHELLPRLDRDFEFKHSNQNLVKGRCPQCDHKSVWTHLDHPWVLRCNRLNNCGYESHVRELYPALFENWSDRHPVTPSNPHAAADAYLKDGRGFDLARIQGWYSQETYWDAKLKIGSATVRFPVKEGTYFERIIDQPQRFGDRKATIRGPYSGFWWAPPDLDLTQAKEIWVVEGIFKAIGLLHAGISAVSSLSTVNYPGESLAALATACAMAKRPRPRLVWAMDADKAGREYTKRYVERARKDGWPVVAAQPPSGGKKLDWDDLFRLDRLQKPHIEEYRHLGALLTAKSAGEKALLIYGRHRSGSAFPFDFEHRLYWFKLDLDKYHKAREALGDSGGDDDQSATAIREEALKQSHVVTEIATCHPQALYFQRNEITEDAWYYFRIDFPHDAPSVKVPFPAPSITSASDFKKRLASAAQGGLFTGSTAQLDALMKQQTHDLMRVNIIDYVGYVVSLSDDKEDKKTRLGAWVLGEIAVKDGKLLRRNEDDYFELGRVAIKSLTRSVGLRINADLEEFKTDWIGHLYRGWGAKGLVVLAWWFGSLFCEQVREKYASWPFFELVGDPGTGKSTLLYFFWRLLGRPNYEGFDPAKGTQVGRLRSFSQVSNMPVVLIESDRGDEDKLAKQKGFDPDELKNLFNGGRLRTTGLKTGTNEIYEPLFRGAVMISQNADMNASEAVQQRVLYLRLEEDDLSKASLSGAKAIEATEMAAVSGFHLKAILAEKRVLEIFDARYLAHTEAIGANGKVKSNRIQQTHGMVAAFLDAMAELLPIDEDHVESAHRLLQQMAEERQLSLAEDHPLVAEFWEKFDYLEPDHRRDDYRPVLNHSRDPHALIAISLPHFEQVCRNRGLDHPPMNELKRVLRTSRRYKFSTQATVNSRINELANLAGSAERKAASVRCWVFERRTK